MSGSLGKISKYMISNVHQYLDLDRALQHKKYNMNNQMKLFSEEKNIITQGQVSSLERNQIQTRILKTLHQNQSVDIEDFHFDDDIREKHQIDSLEFTAIVSSIEEEFNTIFEPTLLKKANSLNVLVQALMKDDKVI